MNLILAYFLHITVLTVGGELLNKMLKVAITELDLLNFLVVAFCIVILYFMVLIFSLNPILVEHALSLPVNLLGGVLLRNVVAVRYTLLLSLIGVYPCIHI